MGLIHHQRIDAHVFQVRRSARLIAENVQNRLGLAFGSLVRFAIFALGKGLVSRAHKGLVTGNRFDLHANALEGLHGHEDFAVTILEYPIEILVIVA